MKNSELNLLNAYGFYFSQSYYFCFGYFACLKLHEDDSVKRVPGLKY